MENIHFKQKNLYNPHKDPQPDIHIYGCGSIGSHTAIGLTKMGFNKITLYDYDEIETSNIPAQFFDIESTEQKDKRKTHQLARIINEFTNEAVGIQAIKITTEFEPEITENSIHIIAFDNIESRQILFDKLKGFPTWIIDGRIGGFQYEVYTLKCDGELKKYEESLKGEYTELECGSKCLWPVNSQIASVIAANILNIIKNTKPTYKIVKNILQPITITRLEQ